MASSPDSPTAYLEDKPVLSAGSARVISLLAPLAIAAIMLLIMHASVFERIENLTIDWRFRERGPAPAPANIVVVEIDEDSRDALKHDGRQFGIREHLPAALRNLWGAGALAIGLDVYLQDLTTDETDAALADAISEVNTVLAVTHTDGQTLRAPPVFLASQPSEGVITVYPDADHILRRLPPQLRLAVVNEADGQATLQAVPHFPLTLAMFLVWTEDETAQLTFEDQTAHLGRYTVQAGELINWTASRNAPLATADSKQSEASCWPTIAFKNAVRGNFDSAIARDAVILVGEVRSIRDSHMIPLSDDLVPGLFYHANVIAHILNHRHLDETWSYGIRLSWLVAVLTFVAGLYAWHQRSWWRHDRCLLTLLIYVVAGVVIFPLGWGILTFIAFRSNVVLPCALPVTGMSIALATGLLSQWIVTNANTRRLQQRARHIEALFGQSVSQPVLAALKQHPERIQQTSTREVSVLFCDLRNFTATSSQMAPADVAAMLNEYFNFITTAVFENDGFVDKFVGDEIMAVFSVPFEQPDHALRAVRTAIAIKQRLADLNVVRRKRGQAPLDCGLGIHTGPAAAGHIGSRERSNYTVVGTTVNLAARIEQYTKSGEILISDAVRRHLPPDMPVRPWKKVDIRGAEGEHQLFAVEASLG